MRTLLRILFGLMILVGALLAIVSPWFADNVKGYEIGRFDIYDEAAGFRAADVQLTPGDAPVFITVLMRTAREFQPSAERAILSLAVVTGETNVVERNLTFSEGPPTKQSPQDEEATYRDGAGAIESVAAGAYVFTIAPADMADIDVQSVELLLHAGGLDLDQRARPAGFILLALGFIGFVLAFRRFTGTKPKNPDETPPPRKWGRG